MDRPHQRAGSSSNSQVGSDFEHDAHRYFLTQGIKLSRNFGVLVGHGTRQKRHHLDLGSASPKVIVECKSHKWTVGDRVPSAKLAVWNEAMYYFHLAPADFRKILFVIHHRRARDNESPLDYYRRTYNHMIPDGVEFMEYDEDTGRIVPMPDVKAG